ncbi:Pol polyprotein [Elysia marginata]|uniref:Pol polyprotein n=1 Tax=Elysia marginata TaxID=1093978 RepID=A0AAV4G8X0_9GAST|nr:Pol polyprotein [Elysia marginata]
MQWKGPFEVVATVGVNDYRINMVGKVKTFHANMLKGHIARDQDIHNAAVEEGPPTSSSAISAAASLTVIEDIDGEHFDDSDCKTLPELGGWGSYETVNDLLYGSQLTPDQRRQLEEITSSYSSIFSDRPGTMSTEEYRIELTSSTPVRQRPYPVPYAMRQTLYDELKKMENLEIIRKSSSLYSSPVVVVKKKDGSNRVCIDYRRLKKITTFDPQPMTPPADVFQAELFRRLREANFTVRPVKCVLGPSTIDFLGHRLGQGTISLHNENVEKVRNTPRPKTKKEVRAFLGLVGFYKEFVPIFAAISAPLSDVVRKGQRNTVNWTDSQEEAYNSLKFASYSEVHNMKTENIPDGPELKARTDNATAVSTVRRDAKFVLEQRAQIKELKHSFAFCVCMAAHIYSNSDCVSLSTIGKTFCWRKNELANKLYPICLHLYYWIECPIFLLPLTVFQNHCHHHMRSEDAGIHRFHPLMSLYLAFVGGESCLISRESPARFWAVGKANRSWLTLRRAVNKGAGPLLIIGGFTRLSFVIRRAAVPWTTGDLVIVKIRSRSPLPTSTSGTPHKKEKRGIM